MGDLRWKRPQPIVKWEGVRISNKDRMLDEQSEA
ncbi:MAG: hypothetical protein J6Z14_01575 [Prevotella sp.]|nr:hypothetical protein [Prevotella sp.]